MQFLPIVERELRVAARQPRTWWRRVLTTSVALVLLGFILLTVGQWQGVKVIGQYLFVALSWVGAIYALMAGPLATVDCLSRERREGTLGLLFLTDLRSYDVVLGKMAAASLNLVLDLVAALPIVAIPILMGGVSLPQLALVALTLVNITFLSLAIGTCASGFTRSGRTALALTLGVMLLLTLGMVLVGEGMLRMRFGRATAGWFYAFCPIHALQACLGRTTPSPRWDYWLNLGATQLLSWSCLLLAIVRTAQSWRELAASARLLRWQQRLERWRKGSRRWRLKWRWSMLNMNPVGWLEGRYPLQERILCGSILGAAIAAALIHSLNPNKWPHMEWVIMLPILAHYALCVWIAIQAPRRLADDRESGALELLLCTPVTPADIVRGCMMMLRRRFGRALLALLLFDLYLAYLYFSEHGGWGQFRDDNMPALYITGLVAFPVQAYSLARIGLYQGLVATNSLRATFMVAWKAGLLPFVTWVALMVSLEALRRHWGFPRDISDKLGYTTWAGAHLLVCGFFLVHSSWRLHWHFRPLAARSIETPWWKRRLRFLTAAPTGIDAALSGH